MHRSGTSLLAGILSRLGVNMGIRFREPDAHNQDGYYEDLDWRDLNKEILASCGGTWYEPPQLTSVPKHLKELNVRIERLVAKKNTAANGRLWGFKDPRLCLTLPIIAPHLPKTQYFRIHRNTDDVVLSLMHRAKLRGYYEDADHWLSLVTEYLRRSTAFLRENPGATTLLSYEQLVGDTYGNVIGIANSLGITNRDAIIYAAELVRRP